MRRNWWLSFTESIRGSLDNDWTWSSGIGCFLWGFTLLTSYGSWAGINGVGMGFHHLPLEVEFPRAPNPLRGCP